jgi:valine--pyruvate aminotransferase
MKYNLSRFGSKFTSPSGILSLMEDLGQAMQTDEKIYMLGGGNPAHIPEVNRLWRERMSTILENGSEYERMVANYDTPRGKESFLCALAEMLRREYGWDVGPENIAVTNGSQTAFFLLLNLFSGTDASGRKKKILFPLLPEYIGYADQSIEEGSFVARKPRIEEFANRRFKYHVDVEHLEVGDDIGAICVSRPTNPTGNVITDRELEQLSQLAKSRGIPLMVDNAYGNPFPSIIFNEAKLMWDEHIILGMSLS